MAQAWKCSGLRWVDGVPELVWDGGRRSALTWGKRVAFKVADGGVRTCVGARGHLCPMRAVVSARSTGARCEECARLDRAHSVAADTLADDPRPYRVYLAWFGPGLVKVGITRVERGSVRLLEQGAVCFSWLGTGPLMAARRSEELLRAALKVPDRIPYADKRAVRSALPGTEAERAAEVRALHARAVALDGWPESLAREPCLTVDHFGVFGLADLPPALGEVSGLVAGGALSGELVAAAGPDLHLDLADGRGVVVLDTRLLRGWELGPGDRSDGLSGGRLDDRSDDRPGGQSRSGPRGPSGPGSPGGGSGPGGPYGGPGREIGFPIREFPPSDDGSAVQDGLF
ncbi:DUF2797 domain-containing protein [Streptomyces sp. DSM 41014]|uniref:DUF2797 domain-containing protein n=1 Tax=Streptomyces hintoniae TaxID=3075521 RepID=A0ABU2UT97_9ACTN|nr:DUF2797 domain-containing protein [Streptomyces sp. DSM 41014]MDT0476510.1 DUF2797 domain-containing protein [Streptomyces sp. DSM 41014]